MKTFLAVFNSLPAILQLVQAVEMAIPLPQSGKHKLNLVLNTAAVAWDTSHGAGQLSKNDTLTMIQTLTNAAVAGMNAAGVFGSSASAVSNAPVSSN